MRAICALLLFIQNVVNAQTLMEMPDNFFSNGAKSQVSVVNEETARRLFTSLTTSDFPWGQSESAASSRAHFIVRKAEKQGFKLGKVFAEGVLNYKPLAGNWPSVMTWHSHSAAVIYVAKKSGAELMALDPFLASEWLTIEEWKARLQLANGARSPRIHRLSFGSRFQYQPTDRPKTEFEKEDLLKMESTMSGLKKFAAMKSGS